MTDMTRVHRSYDRAVQVGLKLNGSHLNYMDLTDLFACCSDVPELVEEVAELRRKVEDMAKVIDAARKWAIRFSKSDMGDEAAHANGSDIGLLSVIHLYLKEE